MGRRVLVVDGNVDAAESLALMLQLCDHEAKVAFTGSDALTVNREFRPDVAFLSIVLPDMSGIEVCRTLLAGAAGERPRLVVALTGCSFREEREAIEAAGFDRYLLKPANPADILALLR